MIATQNFDLYPEFGNNATKIKPDDAKYANGFQEADVLPAEWINWLWSHSSKGVTDLNTGCKMLEQELNSVLTAAGISPDGTTNQLYLSILALISGKIGKGVIIEDADGTNESVSVSFDNNSNTLKLKLPATIKATLTGAATSAGDSSKFDSKTPAQFRTYLSGVTTYTSSTSITPEYDTRAVLNSAGITLTLGAASETGVKVEVYAKLAGNVTHGGVTDALLAGDRACYQWNGTSWDYIGGTPLGQLNYTAKCDTALGSAKAVSIPGFTLKDGTTIKVLFENGYYDASAGQTMSLNVNSLGAKDIYVCKNGSKVLLDSHYLLRTEGGISTEQYWFIMSNTTLELMYDAGLDGYLVLGNPVVLSDTDYTIYADGQIEQLKYSTSEVWTGKYGTDGKKIYSRVIVLPSPTYMDTTQNSLDVVINIDAKELYNCYVQGYRFDDSDNPVVNYGGFYYNHNNGKIVYQFNGWAFYATKIVLEYTKTTD